MHLRLPLVLHMAYKRYSQMEKFIFDLLRAELKDALDIPLVLHGGSSTGDENLARCAEESINQFVQ